MGRRLRFNLEIGWGLRGCRDEPYTGKTQVILNAVVLQRIHMELEFEVNINAAVS